MAKRRPNWFLPGWAHRLARKRRRFAAVRARDGDLCWCCGHEMRFGGPPNCGRAATLEHVKPRALGGSWALENLRLCHVGCNRHLGARTPAQKERMRTNRSAGREAGAEAAAAKK